MFSIHQIAERLKVKRAFEVQRFIYTVLTPLVFSTYYAVTTGRTFWNLRFVSVFSYPSNNLTTGFAGGPSNKFAVWPVLRVPRGNIPSRAGGNGFCSALPTDHVMIKHAISRWTRALARTVLYALSSVCAYRLYYARVIHDRNERRAAAIKRYINHCGGVHSPFKRCYLHFAVCAQLIETVCARRGRDRNLLFDINFVTRIFVIYTTGTIERGSYNPGDIATTTWTTPARVYLWVFYLFVFFHFTRGFQTTIRSRYPVVYLHVIATRRAVADTSVYIITTSCFYMHVYASMFVLMYIYTRKRFFFFSLKSFWSTQLSSKAIWIHNIKRK